MLYCWKKRLEEPLNLLKAGWISPGNIDLYEKLGFETFLLFTSSFSNDKILEIIRSYMNKSLNINFNEYLNFPQPYGNYWPGNTVKKSIIQLDPGVIKEFCNTFPYDNYYPFEKEIKDHCNKYVKQLQIGNIQKRDNIVELITKKMQKIEKGVLEE